MMRAGDVAGAACAGADAGRGLDHRAHHLRVLAHAEIIVGAPDHDVALALGRVPERMREPAGDALEIGEHAVAPLGVEAIKGGTEELGVIHRQNLQRNLTKGPHLLRAFPALMSMRYPTFGREGHLGKMPYPARCKLIPIKFTRPVMLLCSIR